MPSVLNPVFDIVTGEVPASFSLSPRPDARSVCCRRFGSLVKEKIQADDSIMERVAMWTVDTKDMRAAGALLEISDMVLGELLA